MPDRQTCLTDRHASYHRTDSRPLGHMATFCSVWGCVCPISAALSRLSLLLPSEWFLVSLGRTELQDRVLGTQSLDPNSRQLPGHTSWSFLFLCLPYVIVMCPCGHSGPSFKPHHPKIGLPRVGLPRDGTNVGVGPTMKHCAFATATLHLTMLDFLRRCYLPITLQASS